MSRDFSEPLVVNQILKRRPVFNDECDFVFVLQNAVPNVIQKKPREYKLRAFVGFLFLLVVFLVGFAYIFYYQQLSRVSDTYCILYVSLHFTIQTSNNNFCF